jgi:hypothetical protein
MSLPLASVRGVGARPGTPMNRGGPVNRVGGEATAHRRILPGSYHPVVGLSVRSASCSLALRVVTAGTARAAAPGRFPRTGEGQCGMLIVASSSPARSRETTCCEDAAERTRIEMPFGLAADSRELSCPRSRGNEFLVAIIKAIGARQARPGGAARVST